MIQSRIHTIKSAIRRWPHRRPPTCSGCAERDYRLWNLETENRRLVRDLIDMAADLAVAEGPDHDP
jgi:hypothetical protein